MGVVWQILARSRIQMKQRLQGWDIEKDLSRRYLHGLDILSDGVVGVHLVGHLGVVFPRHPLSNG